MSALLDCLANLDLDGLRLQWRNHLGGAAPAHLPRWLLLRLLAYRIQAQAFGDLDKAIVRTISTGGEGAAPFAKRPASTREGFELKSGSLLTREWQGRLERVMTLDEGFAWNGKTYGSLSQVAKAITGTSWNGHRFFGLKQTSPPTSGSPGAASRTSVAESSPSRRAEGTRSAVTSHKRSRTTDTRRCNASTPSHPPRESASQPTPDSDSASEAWT